MRRDESHQDKKKRYYMVNIYSPSTLKMGELPTTQPFSIGKNRSNGPVHSDVRMALGSYQSNRNEFRSMVSVVMRKAFHNLYFSTVMKKTVAKAYPLNYARGRIF